MPLSIHNAAKDAENHNARGSFFDFFFNMAKIAGVYRTSESEIAP